MLGKFEIFVGQDNQYYFHLLSPSGINLGYSEGYTAKHNAEKGIASVKENSKTLSNFKLFKGNDGYYYFRLESKANGETILRSSKRYLTQSDANDGANEVSRYAPNADVVDNTRSHGKVY